MSATLPLHHYRPVLSDFLHQYLATQKQAYHAHFWTEDVFTRLSQFVTAGKLLRGSLLLASYEACQGSDQLSVLPAAAAVELTESGVLVHDDIIDRDERRRGLVSLPAQYRQLATDSEYALPDHQGTSLSLCVGDILFFLSFELLSQVTTDVVHRSAALRLYAQEMTHTGLAEMMDVHQAMTTEPVSMAEIEFLYRYKTGRYSFALPMMLGATLAGRELTQVSALAAVGELLGLIYQIKDDELGLMGDSQLTGKAVGADIREGKKTLHYFYALEKANSQQRELLLAFLGKPDLSLEEVTQVQSLIRQTGALTAIEDRLSKLYTETSDLIQRLPLAVEMQTMLTGLLTYLMNRSA